MFRTTKCSSSGRLVHAVLQYFITHQYKQCDWRQDVPDFAFCWFLLHVCITMHGSRKRKALSTHTIGRTNSPYTSDDTQPDVLWQSTRRRSSRTLNRIQYQTPNYEAESQNAQWSRVRRAGWLLEYRTGYPRRQKPKLKNLGLKSLCN